MDNEPIQVLQWQRQSFATQTSEDMALMAAARLCFFAPGEDSLAGLAALLAQDMQTLRRQCVLVLEAAHAVLDEEGRQLATILAGQGKPVVCGSGCSRCCRQLVLCQPFEAEAMAAWLAAHPEHGAAFAANYAVWDKVTSPMRDSYLAWAMRCFGQGEDDGSHTIEDFEAPCPLLDEEGRCRVYAVRPYACRTCIAMDPACPAPPPGAGVLHVQYSLYTAHHAVRESINGLLLKSLGYEAVPQALPVMLARQMGLT